MSDKEITIIEVDATDEDNVPSCPVCGEEQNLKLQCAGCKSITYCSRRCQIRHWATHKRVCAGFSGQHTKVIFVQADKLNDLTVGAYVNVVIPHIPTTCPSPEERAAGRGRKKRVFEPDFKMDAYPAIAKLGQGSYGAVWKHKTPAGGAVAIKIMDFQKDGSLPVGVGTELLVRNMAHPNVMSLCSAGVLRNAKTGNPESMVIVMDLANMDLLKLINRYKKAVLKRHPTSGRKHGVRTISPYELPYLVYQLVAGLAYCHARMVNILDVKPENIMVRGTDTTVEAIPGDPRTKFKLKQLVYADFGLSRELARVPADVFRGTPEFMAPEFFMERKYTPLVASHFADIWALGCVLYSMATGRDLFVYDGDFVALKGQLLDMELSDVFDEYVTDALLAFPGLADLIRGMLAVDIEKRFDISQVARHPYIATSQAAQDLRMMFPIDLPAPLYDQSALRLDVHPKYALAEMARQIAAPRPRDVVLQARSTEDTLRLEQVIEKIAEGFVASMDTKCSALFAAIDLAIDHYKYWPGKYDPDVNNLACACYAFAGEARAIHKNVLEDAFDAISPGDAGEVAKEQLRIATAVDFDLTRPTAMDIVYARAARDRGCPEVEVEIAVAALILFARRLLRYTAIFVDLNPVDEGEHVFALVSYASEMIKQRIPPAALEQYRDALAAIAKTTVVPFLVTASISTIFFSVSMALRNQPMFSIKHFGDIIDWIISKWTTTN